MNGADRGRTRGWTRVRRLVPAVLLLGIAGFFLWSEHRAHTLGALPYLLLLATPFLHMFMHGGHGGHGRSEKEGDAGRGPHRH